MSHASVEAAAPTQTLEQPSAHHTSLGMANHKLAMWLFIASESMFFAALIGTYMVKHGRAVVGPYPTDLLDIPLTTISTFILLMSSLLMALAVHASHRGNRKGQILFLGGTVLLGIIFLRFQAYEFIHFYHAGLTLSTSLFGSSFFLLTGFHGAHVMVGVTWLSALLLSALRGTLQQKDALQVEIAGLYWHFVDIVWIVVFTVVYLLTEASKL